MLIEGKYYRLDGDRHVRFIHVIKETGLEGYFDVAMVIFDKFTGALDSVVCGLSVAADTPYREVSEGLIDLGMKRQLLRMKDEIST